MHCIVSVHLFPLCSPLIMQKFHFFIFQSNWSHKTILGDPHHLFPSNMGVKIFQKIADNVRHVTHSSEQNSECCQLQHKNLPPWVGAVINKHAAKNNNPAMSATSINKPTTLTEIQKKTSSNSSVENSNHAPPKDITISSPSNSTIPTISTLSKKNSNNLLSLNCLWECSNIKWIPGPKGLLSMMECGYCKKVFPSHHTRMLHHVLNIPHSLAPFKGMRSLSCIYFDEFI